jgi:endoglucanase
MTDILNYMSTNEEYIGWTAWAAGPFWGNASPCCTDQLQWGSLEPYSLASDGSPGYVFLPPLSLSLPFPFSNFLPPSSSLFPLPHNHIIKPFAHTLTYHRLYYTVWLQYIQPLLPKSLQWAGISSINAPAKTITGVKHPGHHPRV